jgi:hypothetical protein
LKSEACISTFQAVDEEGIKTDDPRLKEMVEKLSMIALERSMASEEGEPVLIENLMLSKSTFIR